MSDNDPVYDETNHADFEALYKALEWAMPQVGGSFDIEVRCHHCKSIEVDEGWVHRPDCPWLAAHALLTRLKPKE